MAGKDKTAELEHAIHRFYEGYSTKRIVMATFVVGALSLVLSFVVYALMASGLLASIVFLLVGFIGINVAFLTTVPPASSLNRSRNLICEAIKEPSRIQSYDMNNVQLLDSSGKVQTLCARDMALWSSLVVPYLIESQANGEQTSRKKSQRQLTASERKYIEQRRKEVLEMEKKIESERKRLDHDRLELEARSADLKQAEELVIERLTVVETAEAELEQLRIVAAERADVDAVAYDAQAADMKAAELREKEIELAALKERLAEDRRSFESQKAELSRLQKTVTHTPFDTVKQSPDSQSVEAREAALEARLKQLEAEAEALEARATFLTDSENSLIERLDALSEREAHVEQSEVDAGLRQD
ncbi:hypothetical protein QEH59_13495 [Coraliomargarita sp. SDUM461004]|uniref:Uncharacterized protein n=1 Tax=Thalassobacterium sedimentorum TaxID=3041258 RepID=A0ABU1ANK7_9BACT|nr:hypothetical protein [Coraliomargarita sp. SDUM461004]MDQ8195445.1 hypothetical protein [Coraliomargarita sp. SDUM461004]